MARRFRVKEPVAGFEPGDEFEAPEGLNVDALLEGGFLEEIQQSVPCPACTEDKSVKKADVPNFQKQETLSEHYEKEHPALAPPTFEEVV